MHRATQITELPVLTVDFLHHSGLLIDNAFASLFGLDREQAIVRFQNFVRAGIGLPPVWENLKNQIFLGEKVFVERLQSQIQAESGDLKAIPKE